MSQALKLLSEVYYGKDTLDIIEQTQLFSEESTWVKESDLKICSLQFDHMTYIIKKGIYVITSK
jgi:hypothetical protein